MISCKVFEASLSFIILVYVLRGPGSRDNGLCYVNFVTEKQKNGCDCEILIF